MTTPRHRQIATQLTTMALVFGVGILVGQQFCASPPPSDEPAECPEPELRIVEYCPPPIDEIVPEREETSPAPPGAATPRKSTGEQLPEQTPPPTPQQRRQLLAWVRSQAPGLQSCPRDLGTTYRLAVTLELSSERQIRSASLSSDEPLPQALDQCLKERLQAWQIPEDIPVDHDRLLFHLVL